MRKDSCKWPQALRLVTLLAFALSPLAARALPGDVLFFDDFERGSLGPWTASNNGRAGIIGGDAYSSSPRRGAYTRRQAVTVTSPTIAAAVPAAELSIWVRRGSDAFSEYPDPGEDLVLEYRRADGSWAAIRVYPGGGPAGEIFMDTFQLSPDALHGSLALRLRQTGGSNGNFDWWHFDDVYLTETAPAAPLGIGSCDDFSSGLGGNWTVGGGSGLVGVSGAAYQSPFQAMTLNGGSVTVTSNPIDTADPAFGDLGLWVRRGSDAFSERPDNNENLVIEYLDSSGTWIELETFRGAGQPGQTFLRTYAIPAAGRHPGFRLRFRQLDGSGPIYDFWHVDDVCFNRQVLPLLQVTKLVETLTDPISGSSNPKAIPGAVMRYTVQVSNEGAGSVDPDSLVIEDVVPAGAALLVDAGGADAVEFSDGAIASGLGYDYASDVRFSSQAGGGPPYDYTPVADAQGFDPAVTGLSVTPSGTMNGSAGGGVPSFRIRFRVQLQ